MKELGTNIFLSPPPSFSLTSFIFQNFLSLSLLIASAAETRRRKFQRHGNQTRKEIELESSPLPPPLPSSSSSSSILFLLLLLHLLPPQRAEGSLRGVVQSALGNHRLLRAALPPHRDVGDNLFGVDDLVPEGDATFSTSACFFFSLSPPASLVLSRRPLATTQALPEELLRLYGELKREFFSRKFFRRSKRTKRRDEQQKKRKKKVTPTRPC